MEGKMAGPSGKKVGVDDNYQEFHVALITFKRSN